MGCEDSITFHGNVADVLAVVAPVQRWPMLFPRCRWVRTIGRHGHSMVVQIAARRGLLPVRWTIEQTVFPDEGRIVYRYVKGPTTGMWTEWRICQQADQVHITVSHTWQPGWPVIGPAVADWACAFLFKPFTVGMLTQLRRHVESGRAAALQRLEAALE